VRRPRRATAFRFAFALGMATGVIAATVVAAPAADAHPLGNATINHYDGLHLYPDHVTDLAVEDLAEIPTLQRRDRLDADGDGEISAPERARYAAGQCSALAAAVRLTVNGARQPLTVSASSYAERPGAIQLRAGRLECRLTAPARLSGHATVAFDDQWDGAGIGWHEITAAATGVTMHRSPFPADSVSDTLLRYPNDLLASPLDVRHGVISTDAGLSPSTYAAARRLPAAGGALRLLNRAGTAFNDLVGRRHLTLGVGALAVLLAAALGAGHAFLPGHGKTIMAAYIVGRRGRLRDVVTVGATVTVTHTAAVLGLGLAISLTSAFAPTAAEQDLGILSGLIVAVVGVFLLVTASRPGRPEAQHDPHHHHHGPHRHGFGAGHHHHPVANANANANAAGGRGPFGRAGLLGLGIAGGLVPSPSALIVLLAAAALGRTVFGVTLVLAYGLGMATALTAAGLVLVRVRDRFEHTRLRQGVARLRGLSVALPFATATLVLCVGVGLTLRAASGTI